MGSSILQRVVQKLREENFRTELAFTGKKCPPIGDMVVTVHIFKVDRDNRTVTVEVHVCCPIFQGGTFCETEALRATEALRSEGASCIQYGCEYDDTAKVYMVRILATFCCVNVGKSCIMGPGFRVSVMTMLRPWAVAFHSERKLDVKPVYEIGETEPVGIEEGGSCWEFRLEELIPWGNREEDFPAAVFTMQVESDTAMETYYRCCWTGIRREYTAQGIRQVRTGISMERVVSEIG